MKLYILSNMYCGGVHPGIQGIHSAVRLMGKYTFDDRDFPDLAKQIHNWYEDHETVVLLQSGMDHQDLNDLVQDLDEVESLVSISNITGNIINLHYPMVPFAEFKEPGLNNTITSVAVLCSTEMVDSMSKLRDKTLTEENILNMYGKVLGGLLVKMTYMRTV